MIIILILLYLLTCVASFGAIFGYYQNKYFHSAVKDYKDDFIFSIKVSICGPISLLVAYICLEKFRYGFKFK